MPGYANRFRQAKLTGRPSPNSSALQHRSRKLWLTGIWTPHSADTLPPPRGQPMRAGRDRHTQKLCTCMTCGENRRSWRPRMRRESTPTWRARSAEQVRVGCDSLLRATIPGRVARARVAASPLCRATTISPPGPRTCCDNETAHYAFGRARETLSPISTTLEWSRTVYTSTLSVGESP